MAETKFTKEHWRYSESTGHVTTSRIGIVEGSRKICIIDNPHKSEEENNANGHLIAAAPEMYAALEKIIEMNRQAAQDQYGDIEKAETWDCVKVARETLAKARGERSEILANMMAEDENDGLYDQQTEPQ